jgi:hypothetical protein
MASYPQFGGTNGVPELDIGQAGSARRTANKAQYAVQVLRRPPAVRSVVHQVPQQHVRYRDLLGWSGESVTWQGSVRVKDTTEIAALANELYRFRTGFTRNATTGVPSPTDLSVLAPTLLTDAFGIALGEQAVLDGYQFGENFRRITGDAGWLYWNTLTVVFEVLR